MAARARGWDIPQKAVWAVTRNDLGSTAALCHCICMFPFFNFVFNSVIKGLALHNTAISLHALRFGVRWQKGK